MPERSFWLGGRQDEAAVLLGDEREVADGVVEAAVVDHDPDPAVADDLGQIAELPARSALLLDAFSGREAESVVDRRSARGLGCLGRFTA